MLAALSTRILDADILSGRMLADADICAKEEDTLVNVFGWLGCVSAWLLFLAPMPTMRTIIRKGSVGEFSPLPYFISTLQCTMWTIYALPVITKCETQPLVTNGAAAFLELGYVLIFIRYAHPRRGLLLSLAAIVVTIAVLTTLALLVVPHLSWLPLWPDPKVTRTTTFLGWVCALFNIGMYAAPLAVVGTVIRRRSVDSMPLPLTIGCGLCSGCWTVYSLLKTPPDIFVLAPNIAGVILFAIQISVYRYYSPFCVRRAQIDGDDPERGKPTEALVSPIMASPIADSSAVE